MGKKIVLATVGSLGDLHPFIAVALALRKRGFDPVIAAAEDYRGKVAAEGLAFASVRPSAAQILSDRAMSSTEMVADVARFGANAVLIDWIVPYIEDTYNDQLAATANAALVVTSSLAVGARLAAAKGGLPTVTLLLSPSVILSADDPPVLFETPWLLPLHRLLGARALGFIYSLGRVHLRWLTRRVSQLRRREGLLPVRLDEIIGEPLCADWVACLYSPSFARLPADAPTTTSTVGFSFYDSEAGGPVRLSEPLRIFLTQSPAPLIFGLGSIVVHAAGDFYEDAVAAAKSLGMRAVLLVGPEYEARLRRLASPSVFVAAYAPYSHVFPYAAAIVHQGGIGTVGQALRAGRPQLVCPFLGDQADNAERVVRLGVGRRLDLKRFTAPRASSALRDLLSSDAASRAERLAEAVSKEDGADAVAAGISRMLAGR